MASYDVLAQRCQRATLACVLGLLIVIVIDTLIAPSNSRALSVAVLLWLGASLPLVIFLPGLRRGAINSFAWLSYVSLLYFLHGVTALFASSRRGLDVLHLSLAIALFMCAMLSVRYTARAKRAKLP